MTSRDVVMTSRAVVMTSRDVVITGVSLAYNLISKVRVRSRKLYSSAALLLSSVGTAGASVAEGGVR